MLIPIKRLNWEYKRIEKGLIKKDLLLDMDKKLSTIAFIRKYEESILYYLNDIYSYQSSTAIKIYKITDSTKEIIKKELESTYKQFSTSHKIFDEHDVEKNKFYFAKYDIIESLNYKRIWYVNFKSSYYPFGYEERREVLTSENSNIYIEDNLLVIRGASSKVSSLLDKFIVDFGLKEDNITDLTPKRDILAIFKAMKSKSGLDLKTYEFSIKNPLTSVPADTLTFSTPLVKSGNSIDLEDIDDNEDIGKLILEANDISKVLLYNFKDSRDEYKEEAKIAITKIDSAVRISNRISDYAILNLSKGIKKAYENL